MRVGAVVCALFLAVGAARADDPVFTFKGSVEAGYRFSDVTGNENRYREDINLWSGPRITRAEGEGKAGSSTYVVTVTGIGGDPFPTADLQLKGQRLYKLALSYRGSDYDYASPGDYHTFSTFLKRGGATLDLMPTERDLITVSAEREQRKGAVRVTRGVDFDQFISGLPGAIDAAQNRLRVGYRRTIGAGWLVELGAARTSYDSSEDLAGTPPILPLPDPLRPIDTLAFLDASTRAGHEEARIPELTVRIQSAPARRVSGSAGIVAGRADVDYSLNLFEQGRDASDAAYHLRDGFSGSGRLDYRIYDGTVRIAVTDRLAFTQSVRVDDRSQELSHTESGDFAFPPAPPSPFSAVVRATGDIRITMAQGDLQLKLTQTLTARAGYKLTNSRFDIVRNEKPYDDNDSTGIRAVGGIQYSPIGGFYEILFERGKAADTFTALSQRSSYLVALRARQRLLQDHLLLSGDLRRTHFANEGQGLTDFASRSVYLTPLALTWGANTRVDSTTLGLNLTYTPHAKLEISAGYSVLDASSRGDILFYVDAVQQEGMALYDETVQILDARFSSRIGRRYGLSGGVSLESATGTRELDSQRLFIESATGVVKGLRAIATVSYQRLHEDSSYLLLPLGKFRGASLFLGLRKDFS